MKQLKILGVLAIVLTMGLAGCNKAEQPGDESQASPTTSVEECKKHTWGDWDVVTPADCRTETNGLQKRVCTVCGKEETKPINFAHDWSGYTKTTPATCTTEGVETRTCNNCGKEDTRKIDALGHEWSTEGGTVTPAQGPGYAAFYEYPCSHGCGEKSLGFKANEPTDESKEHLVIDDDGGARFWGRPIGNDVALNDDGDPDRDSHEPVFNEEQKGDFFEYKFDLTAAQAETLANCRCYCDATPAGYMNANGIDFWANKEGDEDWTRGMYIDGEHIGEEITDYRYVLYVDDVLQQFDGTPAPVSSDDRAEFEMPFTFHLHAGTNTIRLCMAGGYRSVFYNFYFRPVAAAD